jgi:hypothetical protein
MADAAQIPASYDEYSALLRTVRAGLAAHAPVITSMAVTTEADAAPRLEIRVERGTPAEVLELIDDAARAAIDGSAFPGVGVDVPYAPDPEDDYHLAGAPSGQEAREAAGPDDAPSTPLHAGMPVAARMDCVDQGTLGWFFVLNGTVVGLSNWHVLCRHGNASTLGDPIWVNCGGRPEPNARLHHFVPMQSPEPNHMDLALARLDDPGRAQGEMPACARPAPVDLFRGTLVPGGPDLFRASGQLSGCQSGRRLKGVMDVRLFGQFWMDDQLVFERLARNGDSGAVIVHESSNTVAALFFMHHPTQSIANPIGPLLAPRWTKVGDQPTTSGSLPIFQGMLP